MEIKRLREQKGMKQKELAEEMGIERSTIAKWETGATNPATEKLPKLAGILGCTIDALFGGTGGEEQE